MTEAAHVRLPDGRRLGYQDFGDPGGAPMFFFHGWIGSRLDFRPNDGVARDLGLRVIAVDRPGCGASDFLPDRRMLDWPDDVAALADALGLGRFGVCGHSFGGPYVAACAYRLSSRLTGAVIVAGVSPASIPGATAGMPSLPRAALWVGRHVPVLTRPYVALMAASVRRPGLVEKGFRSMLPEAEQDLLDDSRFEGFLDGLGEMVRDGSKGAYWDSRVFLTD